MKTSLLTASFAALAAADLSRRFGIGNCTDGYEVREHKSGKIFALECGVSHHGGLMSPNASMPDASTLETCISACGRNARCILAEWNATSHLCGIKISYGVPRVVPGIIAARLEVTSSSTSGTNSSVPATNSSVVRLTSSMLWANSSAPQSTFVMVSGPRSTGAAGVTNWVTQTFLQTVTQIRTVTVTPPTSSAPRPGTVFATITVSGSYSGPSVAPTSWTNSTQAASSSTSAGKPGSSSTAIQLSSSLPNDSKPVSSSLLSSGKPAITLVTSASSIAPISSAGSSSLAPPAASAQPTTRLPAISSAQPSSSALSVSTPLIQPSNTTSAPPVSSVQPAASPPGGKRGLLYNDAKFMKYFGGAGSKVTWSSNWHSDRYKNQYGAQVSLGQYNYALEYVPQLWNSSAEHTGQFDAQVAAATEGKAGTTSFANILAFNEPNQCGEDTGGTCMLGDRTQVLVNAYKKHLLPQGKTARLGSPSVTNGPDGLPWLENFMKLCSDCDIQFVQAHWYGGGMADFKRYIETFYKRLGKPIWLTEFGLDQANETPQKNLEFLQEALKWLDETSYVERYAYFMAAPGKVGLVNEDGSLTEIGKLYNSG